MAGPRYIADPEPLAGAREFEGLTVFYHHASGTTHILAPPAPQILAALAARPGDAAELLSRIMEAFEVEAEDAADAIAARLDELEAAGLVWRL